MRARQDHSVRHVGFEVGCKVGLTVGFTVEMTKPIRKVDVHDLLVMEKQTDYLRKYKVFEIDAENGKMRSMKMRNV